MKIAIKSCDYPGCVNPSPTTAYCRPHRSQQASRKGMVPLSQTSEISVAPAQNIELYEKRYSEAAKMFGERVNKFKRTRVSIFLPVEDWSSVR